MRRLFLNLFFESYHPPNATTRAAVNRRELVNVIHLKQGDAGRALFLLRMDSSDAGHQEQRQPRRVT